MSTRGGVSAFGVLHKSEYAPGKYKPVTEMGPKKRLKVFNTAVDRGVERKRAGIFGARPTVATPENRGLVDAYKHHGYSMRQPDIMQDGVDRAASAKRMKREFDPSHHKPSAVHPNIAYGESVKRKARARLDRKLDSKLTGALKHPVVFHRDKDLSPMAHAAAVPAHKATGGRGHVVLGHSFKRSGKWMNEGQGAATGRNVINHELAHASVKRPPIAVADPKKFARQALGEEGRADAVSRGHVYTKTGAMPDKKLIRSQQKEFKRAKKTPATSGLDAYEPQQIKMVDRQLAAQGHYHKVKRLIRVASKGR
jgi:hypothetical protein